MRYLTLGSLALAGAGILSAAAIAFAQVPPPMSFVTGHVGVFGGERIRYQAIVERFVEKRGGKAAISLVTTSYVRRGHLDEAHRPLLFIFNGGPSASAFELHMELGPMIPGAKGARAAKGGGGFVDNPDSPLDAADLIFLDPAETGFSRILPAGSRSYYYSVHGDAESLTRLIVAWVHRHEREHSPIYLLGESYGSVRAVVMARMLEKRMPVSGMILFGDSLPISETSHGIVGAATALPMEAMAAAYHGMVATHGLDAPAFLRKSYDFAIDSYLPALAQGNALPAARARLIAQELSGFTGIPARYYLTHRLVARRPLTMDTRDLTPAQLRPRQGRSSAHRPKKPKKAKSQSLPKSLRELSAVLSRYMRSELHASFPGLEYRLMAPHSFRSWDWGAGCGGWMRQDQLCFPSQRNTVFNSYDYPGMLGRLFERQRGFRAMIVAGYYDGLSSIGQTLYMLSQHDYPKSRLVYREYASGHATAADPEARAAVVKAIRSFLGADRG